MDRFDAMSVLLAVVDEGSLSAGARKLRTPLTTVSRKISDLEAHLHAKLLVRTSRRAELTEAGRAYVADARRIVEQVQEAERAASGEYRTPRGALTVAAPVVFGRRHVLPVAVAFLAAHAEIDVTLSLDDRSVNLVDDHVDAALRIGALADSALIATRLGSVRRVTCASPDYLARRGAPSRPEDLGGHDAVAFQGSSAASGWQFLRGGRTVVVTPRVRLSVNTGEAAIDAAVAGAGLTRVLSYQVADQLRVGALALVLEAFEPKPLPVSVIHPERGLLPLKTRAFLDWAVPRLRARLAEL